MNRSFYSFAIFFSGLYIILAFFQSIIYFKVGARMYELQSVTGWYVFVYVIAFLWSLMLLKYYHSKQYWFPFCVLTISVATSLFQFILFYNLLLTRELSTYYIIATQLMLITGIIYGISLIFSGAGKRPWLKAAGAFLLFLNLGMMSSFIWAVNSVAVRQNGTMEKVEQWASLIGSLGPVLFIMNFLSERATAEKVNTSRQESLNGLMSFVASIALVLTLIFGPRLALESMRLLSDPNHVSENLKKLARPFEARMYVNNHGDTMRYRLMIPLNYDSTKRYPLVVCLHGSSGCGTDNVKQVATSLPAQLLSENANRKNYPAFLFVPQCPLHSGWGGIPGVPSVDSLVFETINALEAEYPIDETRRYVSGNSLGGYGTWHLICTHPEFFAAAIPISGEGNPKLVHNIVDVPVWAFHGRKDRNVPVSGSQDIIEAIKNAGGNPRYTEYPDEGHDIWKNVMDTPGLLDWLFAQQRD